jgi:hypothetical protein
MPIGRPLIEWLFVKAVSLALNGEVKVYCKVS